MSLLAGQTKQDLLISQESWLKHREATCNIYPKVSKETAYIAYATRCFLDETTNRVAFLEDLIRAKQ